MRGYDWICYNAFNYSGDCLNHFVFLDLMIQKLFPVGVVVKCGEKLLRVKRRTRMSQGFDQFMDQPGAPSVHSMPMAVNVNRYAFYSNDDCGDRPGFVPGELRLCLRCDFVPN